MTITICKRFTFDAAHQLPHHDGKCQRPHGHTYTVDIELAGEIQTEGPKAGMVVDFGDVKAAYRERVHDRCDHQDLNVALQSAVRWTTAECIADWILWEMTDAFRDSDARVTRVRVYETPTAYAEAVAA